MGGPWRDRRFDPTTWRTPVARVASDGNAAASRGDDPLTGIVFGYIASVVTAVAIMLVALKSGW
jgi:hypothetical protein